MVKVCLQVLLVVFTTNLFGQEIGYNKKFLVGSYLSFVDLKSSVTGLTGGGFVICRGKYDIDGSENNIYANIYDKYGKRKQVEFIVNTYRKGKQSEPSVAGFPNGGFVVCWKSLGQVDSRSYGVYAQMFDSSGNKKGEEIQVYTNLVGSQYMPCVSAFPSGGFIVCWQSYFYDDSDFRIYIQRFNPNGEKTGDELSINSNNDGNQLCASITSISNNNFIVCWQSEEYGIYTQQFDINGFKVGNEIKVNTYSVDNPVYPKVSRISNDKYVICWSSSGPEGSNHRIHAQLYNSNGMKLGDELLVSSMPASGQKYPSVTGLTNGGFVICWRGYLGRYDAEMFAQVFNGDGEKLGDEFLVSSSLSYFAHETSVAGLGNDRFIFCWNGINQSEGIEELYGKYYLNNPIEHQLTEFGLLEPKLDSSLIDNNPLFKWTHATEIHINFPWELTYDLYIDTDYNFTNPRVITAIEDTTYQIDSLAPANTYFWKVLARNYYGDSLWSSGESGFYIEPNATDVESFTELPAEFSLSQNYPNPFNPVTTITYSIPNSESANSRIVKLAIFDILGNEITTLVDKEQSPGTYQVKFDGSELASGVYLYQINAGNYSDSKKMLLLR